MISHDERIALTNGLMRNVITPALPESERCCLLVFPHSDPNGACCYMANALRADMRIVLRKLLAKWDAEAALRGEA